MHYLAFIETKFHLPFCAYEINFHQNHKDVYHVQSTVSTNFLNILVPSTNVKMLL